MSAPERVWVQPGDAVWCGTRWEGTAGIGAIPYVPESRLAALEAEVAKAKDEAQRCRERMVSHCEYLKRKHDEVRAERDALVKALEQTLAYPDLKDFVGSQVFDAARAILEGK